MAGGSQIDTPDGVGKAKLITEGGRGLDDLSSLCH